jgi:hypothetical protein
VDDRFENILIKSAYSDITTDFDPSASFEFEIRHTNAFVVLPDRNIRSEKEALNEIKGISDHGEIGNSPVKEGR